MGLPISKVFSWQNLLCCFSGNRISLTGDFRTSRVEIYWLLTCFFLFCAVQLAPCLVVDSTCGVATLLVHSRLHNALV